MLARLILIVLVLVVLPTAVLSLVAGHALRDWELVVQRRLQTTAANAVQSLAARVSEDLDRRLDQVRNAMSDCMARGAAPAEMELTATHLRRSSPLIRHVYLFMNPWGFVWPDGVKRSDGAGAETGPDGGDPQRVRPESMARREALVECLRREVANAGTRVSTLRFTVDDASFAFSPLNDRRNLYAGFEVDLDTFAVRLAECMGASSRRGIVLLADGAGTSVKSDGRQEGGEIIVSDSFGRGMDVRAENRKTVGELLAQGRLDPPFDFIRISAYLSDPDETRRMEWIQARLSGWGILLLAGGILAGAWMVLREAAREIRAARERSDFVMGVSHDLRTPVASMKVLAESLYLDSVTEASKRKRFLATIVRECDRLNQLVERVLFLVRFGQNAMVYVFREINVAELVVSAVDLFRSRFADAAGGDRCTVDIAVSIGPGATGVRGDETALSQVVLNLLDNAYKYSMVHAAAVRIEVEVSTTQRRRLWRGTGEWVVIRVRDHGIGIERADRRRIFRKFYRGTASRQGNVSGVGLGLALCKHVVSAHKGWIELDSTPGRGSSFSVYLPAEAGGWRSENGGGENRP